MEALPEWDYPTIKMFQFLVLLFYNNNMDISFKNQNIYNNQQSFNRSMKKLIKWNAIKKHNVLNNDGFKYCYKLTLSGRGFVVDFLKDFNDRNK